MQGDGVTKVLLVLILACLLVLVGQGVGILPRAGGVESGSAAGSRYLVTVQAMRAGPLVLRTDTVTGQVWRKPLTGTGPWVSLDPAEAAESDPEPPPATVTPAAVAPAAEALDAAPLPDPVEPRARPEEVAELEAQAESELAAEAEGRGDPAFRPPFRMPNTGALVKLAKTSRDSSVRGWALAQLRSLEPSVAIPTFAFLLRDDDPQFVLLAISQLQRAGDPRVTPYLEGLSDHPDPRVRNAASAAIESLR